MSQRHGTRHRPVRGAERSSDAHQQHVLSGATEHARHGDHGKDRPVRH